ncbi:hypothetical protein JOM56_011525 [Amanita muscaria]
MNKEPSVETQPPYKRQRLTCGTPSSFDRKVLESCAEGGLVEAVDPRPLTDIEMCTLLIAILNNDRDLQGTSEVFKIMHHHPELRPLLQDAWESKKFEKIRRLPFLQAPRQDQGGNAHQGHTPGPVSTPIRKAWGLPFQSQAHKVLYETICEIRSPKHNILAVHQSSGYGKTRMLDELAKSVFTFPFIVRNPSETRVGPTYPHPDKCVHKFLTTFGNTETKAEAGYYKFFSYLFVRAFSIIKESDCRLESLPEWWRSYLAKPNNRKKLYSEAVKFAESSLTEGDKQPNQQNRLNEVDISSAVKELLNVVPTPVLKKGAGHEVKAAIYFDEAHELANYQVGPDQKNRLEVLYSCLDVFLPFPLMFIFTSTTSSLQRLASPRAMAPSARSVIGNSVDKAPITELPFDCHHSFPLKPDNYSFQDICKLKFLANFGRPLFWSLLESGEEESSVLALAKNKLAPDTSDLIYHSPHSFIVSPTYSLTAIIDLLLMLDYNPDHQTVQDLQKKLVASHMRTCTSIPADRKYMRSCYPSEPFLAEAAMAKLTQILHPNRDDTYPDGVIDTVNSLFSQGLLYSGDLGGELAVRMLLMDAYMSGCKNGASGKQVIYSEGCKINDFFRCLFQESNQVFEAKPDNIFDGPTLKDAFENAVVRFTHFGKFVDDAATSRDAAHAAFFRSMAIMCHDTQESVDIIIPVLSTTGGVVCRHAITSILIQIKRHVRPGGPRLLPIDQSNVGFFPEDTLCECGRQPRNTELNLPYISFVLDLAVQERPTDSATPATSTPRITPAVQPLVQGTASPEHSSLGKQPKHNRYAIYTRGLSPYCSARPHKLLKYKWLLRMSNVLGDHPHQSPSHLSMVRRLKPFWARGEAFDWIENEALTVHPTPTEECDALEVGKYEDEDDT